MSEVSVLRGFGSESTALSSEIKMDASGMSAVKQSPLQTESTTYTKPFTWKDGIRLVDLAELAKQLRCNRCSTLLDLNNTQDESRVGFASVLSVQCLCGEVNDVRTGKIQETNSVAFEINMKVSMNMLLCGAGGQHVINFLAILDVPLPGDASLIMPPSPPPTTATPNATVTLPGDTSHVMPPLLYCATTTPNATVTLPRMATASSNSGELFYQHTGLERHHFSTSSQFPSQPSAGDSSEMPVVLSDQIKEETVEEVQGTKTRGVSSDCNNGVTAAQAGRSESVHKHISGDDGNCAPLPGLTRDQSVEHYAAVNSVQSGAAGTMKNPEGKGSSTIQRDEEFEETETSYFFDTVTEESDEIDYEAVRKSAERKYYRCPLCPRVLPTSRGFIVHVSRMHHANSYQAEHYELGPNCGYTGDKAQDAVGEDAIPMQATDSVSPAETEVHSPASSTQQKEAEVSSSSQETQAAGDSVVQASDPEQTEQETASQSGRRSLRAAKKSSGKKKIATSTTSKFVCKIKTCDMRFQSELRYKKHLVRVHHIEAPISCQQCSQQFDTHTNLKKHVTCSHTPKEDKVVTCRYCHIPLPTSNAMKKHIKAVHPRGSKKCYPCDECPKTFARPCELKMHKLRHSGAKNYKCFFCDRSFAGSGNRLNHIKMVHDKNPKFLCETCGAGFYRACNLREHERIHSGERPFQCEVCAERFTKKEYLTIHMRTHTDDSIQSSQDIGSEITTEPSPVADHPELPSTPEAKKDTPGYYPRDDKQPSQGFYPHDDKQPSQGFYPRDDKQPSPEFYPRDDKQPSPEFYPRDGKKLNPGFFPRDDKQPSPELYPRDGKKPSPGFSPRDDKKPSPGCYLCDDCGRSYRHKGSLVVHQVRAHQEGGQYVCEVCSKRFIKQGELQSHVNRHSNLKPYSCDKCGKAFANRRNIDPNRHACVRALRRLMHACSWCSKEFRKKEHLRDHEVVHTRFCPYSCSKCNKQFRHRSTLHYHLKKKCPFNSLT